MSLSEDYLIIRLIDQVPGFGRERVARLETFFASVVASLASTPDKAFTTALSRSECLMIHAALEMLVRKTHEARGETPRE